MSFNNQKIFLICLIVKVFLLLPFNQSAIEVKLPKKSELVEKTSHILCSFETKTINVYFENRTASGYSSQILQRLSKCDTSFITMRNRQRTSPLVTISDDGILMYSVLVIRNTSYTIELSIIQKQSAAKHRSHVLILVEDGSTVTLHWLRSTFKNFWQIWFPNVVVLLQKNDTLEVYRHNPFAENFLIKVNYASHIPTKDELFPRSPPNMQLKPLRVCLYDDSLRAIFYSDGRIEGSDGSLARFLAQRLNATLVVDRVTTYGYENRTADLCLNEIVTGRDDMALNIRFLALSTFHKKVEPTIVNSRDDLCVLVPKAKTASTFWNLFRTYSSVVWLLILSLLLLAYGFCMTIHKKTCLRAGFLLHLFGSIITMPFTHPPLKFALRLFLSCWFFYGMLICGAFKGTLTSNLVFRTYLPDVNTLQDLALSPYKLLMFPRHLKHLERFLNISNRNEALIKNKITVVPDGVLREYVRSNNVSFAYLQKKHVARFQASSRQHISFGRPVYHVMENCIVPFHAVFIVPYGSPYLGYLNFLIRASHEFGYAHRWERIMKSYFRNSGKTILRSERTDEDPVILSLLHFQAAFVFWFLGLLVAFLVFLGEVLRRQVTCFFKRQFKEFRSWLQPTKKRQRKNFMQRSNANDRRLKAGA